MRFDRAIRRTIHVQDDVLYLYSLIALICLADSACSWQIFSYPYLQQRWTWQTIWLFSSPPFSINSSQPGVLSFIVLDDVIYSYSVVALICLSTSVRDNKKKTRTETFLRVFSYFNFWEMSISYRGKICNRLPFSSRMFISFYAR